VRDTFDVDVQDQVRAGGQELVFGVAYRISSGRTRGNDTVFFVPANRTDHIFSAFVQDQIAIVKDRLQLNVGSKLERNQYTGFQLQPSARLLWTPGSRQAVWAAVTRAVRTPSRVERDLQAIIPVSPTLYSKLLGDSGFENERMVAYEAGYRNRPTAWLSLDLAVFHNTFGDLLSTETGAPFAEGDRRIVPLRFANLLRGRTSGAELATEAHVSERWVVRAFYAYLNAHLEAKPGSTDTSSAAAAGASPRHNARVQSSWRLPHEVDLDLSLRWVGTLKPGAQAFQRVPS
jgi:iron complex outermembrane receptor protein